MLKTAGPSHLDLIRRIVRSGAMQRSFDASLAANGPAADTFFAKLAHPLRCGRLPQFDPRTQQLIITRVGGYIYRAESIDADIGFGLFRDCYEGGFELWLTGLDDAYRGKGHGRKMIAELLETPFGQSTYLVRCVRNAPGAQRCSSIVKSLGFATCRVTEDEEWMLHARTPRELVALLGSAEMVAFRANAKPSAH